MNSPRTPDAVIARGFPALQLRAAPLPYLGKRLNPFFQHRHHVLSAKLMLSDSRLDQCFGFRVLLTRSNHRGAETGQLTVLVHFAADVLRQSLE